MLGVIKLDGFKPSSFQKELALGASRNEKKGSQGEPRLSEIKTSALCQGRALSSFRVRPD